MEGLYSQGGGGLVPHENEGHRFKNSPEYADIISAFATKIHFYKKNPGALATNSTLTTLDLNSNKVGPVGAGRLAEALAINSTLIILDLSFNKVGDEGAGRLAEALATNSTLTTLNLYQNQVGDEGAGRLAEALPH